MKVKLNLSFHIFLAIAIFVFLCSLSNWLFELSLNHLLYITLFSLSMILLCTLIIKEQDTDLNINSIFGGIGISLLLLILALGSYGIYFFHKTSTDVPLYYPLFIKALPVDYPAYAIDFSLYYPLYPFYDVSVGKWHSDAAFNISLIRSIMNFGYPSVGLDGHPLTTYHILSHYIDCLLYKLSNLEPYQSYGFVYFIKMVFYFYCLFVLCYSLLRDKIKSFCFFLIAAPLIVASNHGMLSHALWSVSFLSIIATVITFKILNKENIILLDYLCIILFAILLCLGKISTGFVFICYSFFILFLRDYNKKRFYIVSLFVLAILFLYQQFINYSYGIDGNIDFSMLNLERVWFVLNESLYSKGAWYIILIQGIFYLFSRNKIALWAFLSSIVSFIIILVITSIFKGFNFSDRTYFYISWYSIIILFVVLQLGCFIRDNLNKIYSVVITLLVFAISLYVYQPDLSLTRISVGMLTKKYYYFISEQNKKFDKTYLAKPFSQLVNFVNDYAISRDFNKSEMALFIPKKVLYESIIMKDKGRSPFYTMNIYAATGVQFINGFTEKRRAYGLSNYSSESLPVDEINYKQKCEQLDLKVIIKVVDYTHFKYEPVDCRSL